MPARRRSLAAAAFAILLTGLPSPAAALVFSTEYAVSLRGVPIGAARLEATIEDGGYTIAFSGSIKGLARLFSDAHASAASAGEAHDEKLLPSEYTHRWTEDDDTERVLVRFTDAEAAEISIDPPPRHPERDVPVTAAHKRGVLDPASAFLWPAPAGTAPQTCERTLHVFSGRHRFDLALSYNRSETFRASDGSYSGPAIVCAMRYIPVSGHRPDRESVRFMAENREMEVWMAPAGQGWVAPVKIRLRTKFGRLVLDARRFFGS